MSWDWGSLVDSVTSAVRAVEAQIDTVVGIPPNAPLIDPSMVAAAEAPQTATSLPSVRSKHSAPVAEGHEQYEAPLAVSKTTPDLRAQRPQRSTPKPRAAVTSSASPVPTSTDVDAQLLEEMLGGSSAQQTPSAQTESSTDFWDSFATPASSVPAKPAAVKSVVEQPHSQSAQNHSPVPPHAPASSNTNQQGRSKPRRKGAQAQRIVEAPVIAIDQPSESAESAASPAPIDAAAAADLTSSSSGHQEAEQGHFEQEHDPAQQDIDLKPEQPLDNEDEEAKPPPSPERDVEPEHVEPEPQQELEPELQDQREHEDAENSSREPEAESVQEHEPVAAPPVQELELQNHQDDQDQDNEDHDEDDEDDEDDEGDENDEHEQATNEVVEKDNNSGDEEEEQRQQDSVIEEEEEEEEEEEQHDSEQEDVQIENTPVAAPTPTHAPAPVPAVAVVVPASPSTPTMPATPPPTPVPVPVPSPPVQTSRHEIEAMQREFGAKIAELEKKLLGVTQERELWKNEAKSRGVYAQLESLNETNKLLREEGEQLSKKQMQYEGIMKKLRSKEKEQEAELSKLRMHVATLEQSIATRGADVSRLQESEKRRTGDIKELSRMLESSEAGLKEARASRDRLAAENLALQQSLQDAQKELASVSATHSTSEIQSEKRWKEAEAVLKQEHEREVEALKQQYDGMITTMARQAEDLREQVSHEERKASRLEDELRSELRSLQDRLQQANSDNAELYSTLSSASQPYLQQISSLQSAIQVSQRSLEGLEKSSRRDADAMKDRVAQLEMQLRDKERGGENQQAELTKTQRELGDLRGQLERHRSEEESRRLRVAELEKASQEALRKANAEHERAEQIALDAEKAQLSMMADVSALKAQNESLKSQVAAARRTPPAIASQSSPEVLPPTGLSPSRSTESLISFAQAQAGGAMTAATIQKTFELLRQREAEVFTLRDQLEAAQDLRARLETTIVELNSQQEQSKQQVTDASKLAVRYKRLTVRHETALELIGQKDERVSELEADLAEFKELYRTQVDDLLKTIEAMK